MSDRVDLVNGVEKAVLDGWIRANEESLIKQSRSFAIPILKLDTRFRTPIMVEYNLNKTVDTIEDSNALDIDEKRYLIDSFCTYLRNNEYSSEVKRRMLDVTPKAEAFVFKNYETTLNLFNTLSDDEKRLSQKWTTEMAKGMKTFLTKSINTLRDLNDYCYYVAGTVGLYLTNLLKLKGSNLNQKAFNDLEQNAISFGLFLQKLNIIRDFKEDKADKQKTYWPQTYFEQEKDRVKILNKMCHETLKNDVPHAIEYFFQIPTGNDSYEYFIRFVLSSGIEYLKILKGNRSVFSRAKVKLPRKLIENLYAKVASVSREQFRTYCERLYAEEMAYYSKA